MAYVNKLFDENFLEYASYVIKDRAIPHINDGLKPVQRRILHSLFEMDDGKFNKVANVVGHCMQYHPHGDASIYSALVVLANKDLFIEKQGNFGNIFTGDQASAARYIECRLFPFARDVLYNPEITEYEDSYDGRNREPLTFPAKIPIILIQGAEGIAVGMSTKILPHNFIEVLDAVKAALEGKSFQLYPDFPTGGIIDVSEYADGQGKVLVRAKLDTSDDKRIIIKELPFGCTTESLINSIENAAKKNKIKIASINDFTTEEVEIEIKLPRGVYAKDILDALYAFTDCEISISVNLLLIRDKTPQIMTVSEVIQYHARQLVEVLKAELKLEEGKLKQKLHDRTLDQIFIEERIYKKIEQMKTQAKVVGAVINGFKPFTSQIKRAVTEEDVERLLKIPIRRISLYDIGKVKQEIKEIKARIKEIRAHLKNLVAYALGYLEGLLQKEGAARPRQSEILSFDKVDVREAAQRNLKLYYNDSTGYLGTNVSGGKSLFDVSVYDKILVIRKTGGYSVIKVPDKLFVDTGMLFCCLAEKEYLSRTVISVVYQDESNGYPFIKRCIIDKFIMNRGYALIPENCSVMGLGIGEDLSVVVQYKPKPRLKILEETIHVKDYLVKGLKAAGVRIASRELKRIKLVRQKKGYAQTEINGLTEAAAKTEETAAQAATKSSQPPGSKTAGSGSARSTQKAGKKTAPKKSGKKNATTKSSPKSARKKTITKKSSATRSKKTSSVQTKRSGKAKTKKSNTKKTKKKKAGKR